MNSPSVSMIRSMETLPILLLPTIHKLFARDNMSSKKESLTGFKLFMFIFISILILLVISYIAYLFKKEKKNRKTEDPKCITKITMQINSDQE